MQRVLSIATLGVLGGLVWMFLRGGGTNPLAGPAGPNGAPTSAASSGFGLPGFLNPGGSSAASPTSTVQSTQAYLPTVAGTAAPPAGTGPTIRIASFNIQVFGKTKSEKPYVMYTLAEIVRQFDVIAIQEIRSQDDYLIPNFIKLINSNGRHYDHVIGPRLGNTKSTEQYAFLFDSDRIEVDFQSVYTVGDPDNLLQREPLVASFRTRGVNPDEAFTFTLMDVHTDPDVASDECEALAEAYRVVRQNGRGEDDVIMLGDFNEDDAHLGRLTQIPGVKPCIHGVFSNTLQKKLYDNILIHQPSTTEYTGNSGVFDVMRKFNLTLDQAQQVSDHFPVWAEFSVYERDYQGRIASRRSNAR